MEHISKTLNQASRGTDRLGHLTTSRQENRTCACGKEFGTWVKEVDGKVEIKGSTVCWVCSEKEHQRERKEKLLVTLPQVQEEQKEVWLDTCNLPVLFINKTFANFERKLQPKAYDIMKKYDGEKSIILLSPDIYGVGKTHLLAALINNLIETGTAAAVTTDGYFIRKYPCPVYFTAENTLLSRIRATYNRRREDDEAETEEDIFQQLENYAHLLIDDVGKVRPRDYSFLQGTYFRIIDYRYTNQLPIIITTNLSLTELETHVGGACADRLLEMAGKENFIVMSGSSYRKSQLKRERLETPVKAEP